MTQNLVPPTWWEARVSGVPQVEGVLLADESEVVVAAGGVRDGGATVDSDAEGGGVQAVAAVDDPIVIGIADPDGVTGVAAAVDVADGHGAPFAEAVATPPLPAEAVSMN